MIEMIMNVMRIILFIYLCSGLTKIYSQQIDKERLRWEVHISAWSPKLGNYPAIIYPYMLKRNVGNGTKLGAWRLTLSPFYYLSDYHDKMDPPFNWTKTADITLGPIVQAGYEWQKRLGASIIYYGTDIGWQTRSDILNSNDYQVSYGVAKINPKKLTTQTSGVWLAGLGGMKHYISNRFSISIESQLQIIYNMRKESYRYEDELIYSDRESALALSPFAFYMLNFSYNF